jgi:F-type H+-transporting ATPase subunit gamma
MAVGKEIRNQIKSIKNTQKITKAMEMVAASKMRKAQDRMRASRPYAEKMLNVVGHLANAHPEYKHPFLIERPVKRVGVIIISTDRGLCGGLNTNAFKAAVAEMRKWHDQGTEIDVCTIGAKAEAFFKRVKTNIVGHVSHLGDAPRMHDLIGTVKIMLEAYNEGRIDRLILVYSKFVNTMTQAVEPMQLLPIQGMDDEELKHHWDYLYEPEAKEVMDDLLMRYVESLVYQGVVDNIACEQAARMVAMKAASDNAGNFIADLQLVYNKARQAAITQELSEIVGGAAAV